MTFATKGKARAVYSASRNAVRRKIPQEMKLPMQIKINLATISLKNTIINTDAIRIGLLSSDISLDNFITHRLNNAKIRVFIPNVFTEKISLRTPAQMLKSMAHLNSKNILAQTTQIKRRSGFTWNMPIQSRIVACNNPTTTIIPKKVQFLTV